jgi:hypothetical protein
MQANKLLNKFSYILRFTTLCSVVCISTGPAYAGSGAVFNTQEVNWLTRLAKSGDNGAQLELGLAYEKGLYGLQVDEKTSFYWLNAAARGGNAYAADVVANRYAIDKPEQVHKAVYWWDKAAHGGNADAEVHLAEYMVKQGADDKALPWLRKAADMGSRRAHQELVTLYHTDSLSEADLLRGDNKIDVIAHQVDSASVKTLFAVWHVLEASSTYLQSTGPLISRAKQGDPIAEYQLAVRYRDGAWDVNSDPQKSMSWLQRSAAAGNPVAKKDLAHLQQQVKSQLNIKSHVASGNNHT